MSTWLKWLIAGALLAVFAYGTGDPTPAQEPPKEIHVEDPNNPAPPKFPKPRVVDPSVPRGKKIEPRPPGPLGPELDDNALKDLLTGDADRKEWERAFNGLDPDVLYRLYVRKAAALLTSLQAVKTDIEGIKTNKWEFPEEILKVAVDKQVAEFTDGEIARRAKKLADMTEADRKKALAQEKKWLLESLARVELVNDLAVYAGNYAKAVRELTDQERKDLGRKTRYNKVELSLKELAGSATKVALETPGEDSLYHKTRADLITAQEAAMKQRLQAHRKELTLPGDIAVFQDINSLAVTYSGMTARQYNEWGKTQLRERQARLTD